MGKNSQPTTNSLYCKKCDYLAKRPSDFNKHIKTKKHLDDKWMTQNSPYVCDCGKRYKYRQGLFKHQNKCHKNGITHESLVDALKEVLPTMCGQTIVNNIQNKTVIHNEQNINLFLNSKCAEAMSIQDFVKQITISVEDMLVKKSDCLQNILLKNIQPLGLTERPFHCSNIRQKQWHVKDEKDGWEIDDGEKILQHVDMGISKKWPEEFEQNYPDWKDDDNIKDKYLKAAHCANSELPKKVAATILKSIAEEVSIAN